MPATKIRTGPDPTPDTLADWRNALGLTQPEAAEIAGVTRLTIARWEGGTRPIPQWLGDVLAFRTGSRPAGAP